MYDIGLFISLRGALITVLLILGFISVLVKPKVGVWIIISLSILRAGFLYEWFPLVYELHIPQVFIILTLVSWLFHSGSHPLRLNVDIGLMFLFFLIICYSRYHFGTEVFGHKIPNDFFREVIIFFLAVQLLRQPKDIKITLCLIVALYLFLTLRAYYFYKITLMPIAVPSYKYVNRNGFAKSLALVFPIAYMLGRMQKNSIRKGFFVFASIGCVIGVILTYSRGGFLTLIFGMCGLLFFEKKRMRLILMVLILSFLIVPRLSEKYVNRIKSIETYQEDTSSMGRVATNYAAINMIKENPLFGVGAGNYNDVFIYFTPSEDIQWVKHGKSIHNVVLQAASETGIVGLLIFLLLIFRGVKNTFIGKIKLNGDATEYYDFAIMLRIALLTIFFGKQLGQGAYFGELYLLLPIISALKGNVVGLLPVRNGIGQSEEGPAICTK